MRDYGKVSPGFWTGKTGKALKAKGTEAVIVALYLMTCQHSNMLGLYYLSKAYIAVDTPLGFEGASKGLQGACEVGFCHYDDESEVVWVVEMAAYQIAEELKDSDLRCKGIQREYDALPENPFLTAFYERYGAAFHMSSKRGEESKRTRPSKAPTKPLRSQEQEQEQEQEQQQDQENPSGSTPGKPARRQRRGAKFAPDDFEVTAELQAWAGEEAPLVDWKAETEKFRDWEFKHPRTDWTKVWRTWMRKANEEAVSKAPRRGTPTAPPAQSFAERDRLAAMERWEEMTGQTHPDREKRAPLAHVIDEPILALGAPA
jgi:hypothetical protein